MKMSLRLVSLTGAFRTVSTVEVEPSEALAIVKAHADSGGYRDVRAVEDGIDGVRYTATTPGGRRGRNVAFGDYY